MSDATQTIQSPVTPDAALILGCVVVAFMQNMWVRNPGDAVEKLWPAKLIRVCHPAARQPETIQRLKGAAAELMACAKQPNK